MKEMFKSGAYGNAAVVFGGKIGAYVRPAKIGRPNCMIAFSELENKFNPGDTITEGSYNGETQVHLIFDSIESINVVQGYLNKAKYILKRQLEEE